ncbi:MAG TPA: LysR family transcriptional regulator [Steroidobacteraceae bacterium]|jgi:DNA-binding transcriptional LysR family regulator
MRGTQFAQLTAFVAVAEHRSFTKAASYLGIKAPSLSQAIRELEETFGVRLLHRTTRSVALTEAGEKLLGHLNPVLEGVDRAIDAVNEFRDNPAGTLRLMVHPIAAVTVIGPLVARFSAEYPAISLEISVEVERKDIVSERFDAGIHLGEGIAQDMIAVPIGGNFRLSTVASPDYLARHASPSVPEDLRDHNCIRYCGDTDGAGHPWRFQNAGRQVEVSVEGSLSVNDITLALRAGVDGVGIVQLPEACVSPLVSEGKLVQLLEPWSPRWTDFCLFYSSRRHVPVKLRTLVDFLRRESKHFAQAEREQTTRGAIKLHPISLGDRQRETSNVHATALVERNIASAI